MSRRSSRAFLTVMLIAAVCPSVTTYARDPNAPPVQPPVQEAKTQAPAESSSNKPAAPAKRTPASFTPEMPFSEAVDILRNSTTTPLNIVVLWKEIGENAGIYRETPIGISGVPGLRVGQYLDLLLLSLSGSASAKLSYTISDGVITVGTTGSLRAPRKITRVYDISDLVAEPARYAPLVTGLAGLYGSAMMGPAGGYGGGYGAGSAPGTSYAPARARRDQGLANGIGSLYGATRRPNVRRR